MTDQAAHGKTAIAILGQNGDQVLLRWRVLKREFPDGSPISQVGILSTAGRFYLVRSGIRATGNAITSAIPLTQEGTILTLSTSETENTCTGDNCSSCDFVMDKKGNITGCACKQAANPTGHAGGCNHTVSTTDDDAVILQDTGG